jgi:hypothetical protein
MLFLTWLALLFDFVPQLFLAYSFFEFQSTTGLRNYVPQFLWLRYALNLLHAHEIRCDYSAAYTVARNHLLSLKSCGSLVGLSASSLKEASIGKHSSLSALIEHGLGEEQGTWSVAWHDDKKKGSSPYAVVTFTQGDNRAESDTKAPKK